MIVRVAFASPSIDDLTAGSSPAHLSRLARQIQEKCWVFFDSDASRSNFLQRITASSPSQLAELWAAILTDSTKCRTVGGSAPALDEDLDNAKMAAWSRHSDVVAVPGYQFELLVDLDLPEQPELCRVRELSLSHAFDRLEHARHDPLLRGSSRESAWTERFDVACRNARLLYLVDSHLGEQIWRGQSPEQHSRADGARWFFSRLSAYPIQRVFIATDLPRECRSADLEEAMHQFIADLRPPYEVRLLPVYSGIKWPVHTRHARFDTDFSFQLEKGLDTFAHDPFDQNYPCNWVDPQVALDDYRTIKKVAKYAPSGLTL